MIQASEKLIKFNDEAVANISIIWDLINRREFMWKSLLFHTDMISEFLWANVLLGGELQIDPNNSNF